MVIKKVDDTLSKLEGYCLTTFLMIMISLAFLQVLLRNFFHTGITWADPIVRHLVLWVGFIGASIATKDDGHLAMDLVSRFLPAKIKKSSAFFVQGTSALICAFLTIASYKFVLGERESETMLIPGFPSYWAVIIIPLGFYFMSMRFARKAAIWLTPIAAILIPFLVFAPQFQNNAFLQNISLKFSHLVELIPTAGPAFLLICVLIGAVGLLGAPLFIIFGAISLLAFHTAGIDSSATIIEMYRLASAPTLVAIPLFTFAGYLMAESKTPERLIAIAKPLFGWMPGGLAIMAIVACAFFTAFTGASGVTIIALGGLLYPILLKEKYPDGFSMGLVTTCGSVGLMFPPSLPLILFGLISGTNIDKLFIAGIAPGFLIILLLAIYGIIVNRKVKLEKHPFSFKELVQAIKKAGWEVPLPFIILFGIYGGFITASEAAAVTAAYVFIVQVFIYKDLKLTTDVPRIAKQSMVLVGSIVVIFAVAMGFTSYLIDEQVPMKLLEWIRTYITSRVMFLLVLNVFLLIVGSLMDIFSAIIVVVPLIIPIAKEFGVDPIHLGIIFLTNLEIGYLHPPVGLNLFLSSIRFKRSIVNLYWVTLPFLILLVLALIIITYVPELSLGILHHMGPKI